MFELSKAEKNFLEEQFKSYPQLDKRMKNALQANEWRKADINSHIHVQGGHSEPQFNALLVKEINKH